MFPTFWLVFERPGELNKDSRQALVGQDRFYAEFKFIHFFDCEGIFSMCEILMKFYREHKLGIMLYFFYPGQTKPENRGPVKCAVHFNDVDIFRQKKAVRESRRFSERDIRCPPNLCSSTRLCPQNIYPLRSPLYLLKTLHGQDFLFIMRKL